MSDGTIFFGTDFSPASDRAFLTALDEAKLRSAELVVAHVIPTSVLLDHGIGEVAPLRAICLKKLEALRRRAEAAGVAVRIELLDGTPHAAIVEAAARANAALLVLGTQGRTGVSRLVFGSVAMRVVSRRSAPSSSSARRRDARKRRGWHVPCLSSTGKDMNYKALILAVILSGAVAAAIQEPTPVPTPVPPPRFPLLPLTPPPRPEGTPPALPTPEIIPTPNPTPELRGSRTPGIPKLDPLRTPGISRTPGGDPGDKIVPPPTPGSRSRSSSQRGFPDGPKAAIFRPPERD